jgi:hypothetical protein
MIEIVKAQKQNADQREALNTPHLEALYDGR